jgi:hypothetical protein
VVVQPFALQSPKLQRVSELEPSLFVVDQPFVEQSPKLQRESLLVPLLFVVDQPFVVQLPKLQCVLLLVPLPFVVVQPFVPQSPKLQRVSTLVPSAARPLDPFFVQSPKLHCALTADGAIAGERGGVDWLADSLAESGLTRLPQSIPPPVPVLATGPVAGCSPVCETSVQSATINATIPTSTSSMPPPLCPSSRAMSVTPVVTEVTPIAV